MFSISFAFELVSLTCDKIMVCVWAWRFKDRVFFHNEFSIRLETRIYASTLQRTHLNFRNDKGKWAFSYEKIIRHFNSEFWAFQNLKKNLIQLPNDFSIRNLICLPSSIILLDLKKLPMTFGLYRHHTCTKRLLWQHIRRSCCVTVWIQV